MDKPIKTKSFIVKEGDREMKVIIPLDPDDRSYNEYLEEAEREITADQLKRRPPRKAPTVSKEEMGGLLREYNEYRERKRKKYY